MANVARKRKIAEILINYFQEKGKIVDVRELEIDKPQGLNRKLVKRNYKSYSIALHAVKTLYPKEWEALQPKKESPLEQLKSALSTKPVEEPID